jgi:hypothetical protein
MGEWGSEAKPATLCRYVTLITYVTGSFKHPVKSRPPTADNLRMMISHEQARAAALHIHEAEAVPRDWVRPEVSPDLIAAAVAVARDAPDADPERIADVQAYREGRCVDSRAVASMMLQRIVSDSLR